MEKKIKQKTEEKKFIAVIRIKGQVEVVPEIKYTLERLNLHKKYSCVLINPENPSLSGMLKKVKYYVAYGGIEKEILIKLLKERAKKIDGKKFDSEKIAQELLDGKNLKELGFVPVLRLHPPRKGIKSKIQYPKGVLGNNGADINKLIERML
jgi:large subunit ribosomal protein L30